jgi:hypothetical protein
MKATYFVMIFLCHTMSADAQIGQKIKTESQGGIAGLWRNNSMGFNMDLLLENNGKGKFDEEAIAYQFSGTVLTIIEGGKKTAYQAKLSGDELALSGGDLDAAITFTRVKNGTAKPASPAPVTGATTNSGSAGIIGTWTAQNEEITFTKEGIMIYNGAELTYKLQGDLIIVQAPAGSITFQYTLNGNYLTLKSDNLNAMYVRKTGSGNAGVTSGGTTATTQTGDGIIDQSLVGKWSYVGSANNPSGSFSTEEYITLNADGTYEYRSESSGSASGTDMYGNQTYAGGTASQGFDKGTWRVKGNTIIANSQRNGVKVYQLQKKNHPKNGDPMIVLDGTAYVTYYQKAPWR